MNYQGNHYHSSVREVLDSLYSNVDQEAEEAAAEAGAVEGSLPVKLTFVTVVETLIRMINTLSLGNKKVGDQYENKQIFLATFFLQENDILELISEGFKKSKEDDGEELGETNEKSDEPTEKKVDSENKIQKGKEIQDKLVTHQESLVENQSNGTKITQQVCGEKNEKKDIQHLILFY